MSWRTNETIPSVKKMRMNLLNHPISVYCAPFCEVLFYLDEIVRESDESISVRWRRGLLSKTFIYRVGIDLDATEGSPVEVFRTKLSVQFFVLSCTKGVQNLPRFLQELLYRYDDDFVHNFFSIWKLYHANMLPVPCKTAFPAHAHLGKIPFESRPLPTRLQRPTRQKRLDLADHETLSDPGAAINYDGKWVRNVMDITTAETSCLTPTSDEYRIISKWMKGIDGRMHIEQIAKFRDRSQLLSHNIGRPAIGNPNLTEHARRSAYCVGTPTETIPFETGDPARSIKTAFERSLSLGRNVVEILVCRTIDERPFFSICLDDPLFCNGGMVRLYTIWVCCQEEKDNNSPMPQMDRIPPERDYLFQKLAEDALLLGFRKLCDPLFKNGDVICVREHSLCHNEEDHPFDRCCVLRNDLDAEHPTIRRIISPKIVVACEDIDKLSTYESTSIRSSIQLFTTDKAKFKNKPRYFAANERGGATRVPHNWKPYVVTLPREKINETWDLFEMEDSLYRYSRPRNNDLWELHRDGNSLQDAHDFFGCETLANLMIRGETYIHFSTIHFCCDQYRLDRHINERNDLWASASKTEIGDTGLSFRALETEYAHLKIGESHEMWMLLTENYDFDTWKIQRLVTGSRFLTLHTHLPLQSFLSTRRVVLCRVLLGERIETDIESGNREDPYRLRCPNGETVFRFYDEIQYRVLPMYVLDF